MIGIYKITSPSDRVYIGQSVNIKKRFKQYKNCRKDQPLLYRSFKKHGIDNHKFEVLAECHREELNRLERYFQDVYFGVNPKRSLNCVLTKADDRVYIASTATRKRISNAAKNSKALQLHLDNLHKTINKMPQSEAIRKARSIARTGIKNSQASKEKMAKTWAERLGNGYVSENWFQKKEVAMVDLDTDKVIKIFDSVTVTAAFGYNKNCVSACATGKHKTHKKAKWLFKSNLTKSQLIEYEQA